MSVSQAMKDLLNKASAPLGRAKLGDLLGQLVTGGSFTTVGGDATESIVDTNVAVGDLCFVTVKVAGATPRSIVSAVAAAGAITVVCSGDPSTDHVLQYVVIRPTAVS